MHKRGVPPYAIMLMLYAIEHGYYDEDKTKEERDAIVEEFCKTIMKGE